MLIISCLTPLEGLLRLLFFTADEKQQSRREVVYFTVRNTIEVRAGRPVTSIELNICFSSRHERICNLHFGIHCWKQQAQLMNHPVRMSVRVKNSV